MKGVLKTWKEDRGFGFITPDNGGRDVFIHISAIGEVARRPVPGDVIHYQITRDKHGKLRAVNAYIEGLTAQKGTQPRQGQGKSSSRMLVLITVTAALVIGAAIVWYLHQGGFI